MNDKPKYNPQIHHRRSVRLQGYDYSQAGLYFITICCHNREWLFGEIENGEMILNDAGKIANECWLEIPKHFPNAVLHEQQQQQQQQFWQPIAGSISVIIQQFKSSVKRWCNKNGHEHFKWQRNYHEHIIRNEQSFQTISEYIINNPSKW